MSAEELVAIAGVIISMLFEYLPKLHDWYNAQPDNYQRLMMLGLMLAAALGAYGLSCAGVVDAWACDKGGLLSMIKVFLAAVIANQATYVVLPRRAVKPSAVA